MTNSGKTILPLLFTLLLVAVVGTGISHWFTSRELKQTLEELQSLRNRTGQITLSNADHFHAIALPITEGVTWEWRLHIPPGNKYRMRWAIGHAIPRRGFPEEFDSDDLDEVLFSEVPQSPVALSARIHTEGKADGNAAEEGQTGPWILTISHLLHEVSIPVDFGDDIDWLVKRFRCGSTLAGHNKTESFPPEERIVLLRVRRFKDAIGGAYSIDEEPCDGIIVWLEPM